MGVNNPSPGGSSLSSYVKDNFLTKLVLQDLALSSETRCTLLLAVAMDND